ncbi:MAG: DUF2189 domain-containing protein [Burkholderiales bacterium]|nr:DUF2189 domain-containing protein [Burkholderiales bacterium]
MPDSPTLDAARIVTRSVPVGRPWHWLALGARDLRRAPLPGLAHGLACAIFGLALVVVAGPRFWLLAGAFSGFLLVAPIVATGLYAVSRALERGEPAGLATALAAWRPQDSRLVVFGLLLALAGTGWVLTSAGLITGLAPQPVRDPMDFVHVVVLGPSPWLFGAWLVLGAVLAAPVFASSVVAIPLLLDRRVGVAAAVYASWRVVVDNPVAMALWAFVIMALSALAFALALLGLVVVVPLLAHASWHAYRELVAPA